MLLELATWPEVDVYLAKSRGIIIPIGSTEQHGPTGLIGTDFINAMEFAQAAGDQSGAMVAPPLAVGMAQHHMAFAGTMTLRPQTYISVLVDWINSLAHHGFKRIYFVNGHGGNIAPTLAAFNEFYAETSLSHSDERADVLCKLVNWWMMPATAALITEIFGDDDGIHATASEIAVTHHVRPEAIKDVPPGLEKAVSGSPMNDIHNAADYRRRFVDGRIGSDVSTSDAEKGRRVFECCAAEIAEDYRKFASDWKG